MSGFAHAIGINVTDLLILGVFMTDLEIWKIVKLDVNSTGLLISSNGNIKNHAFVDRKVGDNGAGYKYAPIKVVGEKRQKTYYIHRLVAQHFLPQPLPQQTQVNHIDGDKSNNHYTNLEWTSKIS